MCVLMAGFKLFAASEDTNHSFLMLLDIYPPPHLHWHLLSLTSPWCQTALCFAGHFANGWEDLLLLGAGLAAVMSGSLTVRSCLLLLLWRRLSIFWSRYVVSKSIFRFLVVQVGGYLAFRAQLATLSTGLTTLGREFTTLAR